MGISNMLKIRVHCWGGLGSQVYCLALALDLMERFPFRKVHILFHTGGLTHRKLELIKLPEHISYSIIEDFSKSFKSINKNSTSSFNLKKTLKKLVSNLGLIAAVDTTLEFRKLKPWVVSIRGHYSHRLICDSTVEQMDCFLKLAYWHNYVKIYNKSLLALQYRWGDLVAKKKSSIVQVDKILGVINDLKKMEKLYRVDVFSDSNQNELENLLSILKPLNIQYVESTPLNTIYQIRDYNCFIGTNSKISIWAIIFRLKDDITSSNYCPENLLPLLNYNVGDLDMALNLKTF
jgi:hypothetical protein